MVKKINPLQILKQLPKGLGLDKVIQAIMPSKKSRLQNVGGHKTHGPVGRHISKTIMSKNYCRNNNKYTHKEDGYTPAGRRRAKEAGVL